MKQMLNAAFRDANYRLLSDKDVEVEVTAFSREEQTGAEVRAWLAEQVALHSKNGIAYWESAFVCSAKTAATALVIFGADRLDDLRAYSMEGPAMLLKSCDEKPFLWLDHNVHMDGLFWVQGYARRPKRMGLIHELPRENDSWNYGRDLFVDPSPLTLFGDPDVAITRLSQFLDLDTIGVATYVKSLS